MRCSQTGGRPGGKRYNQSGDRHGGWWRNLYSVAAMQSIPFGMAKLCLSTAAAKDLSRQVGSKDIYLNAFDSGCGRFEQYQPFADTTGPPQLFRAMAGVTASEKIHQPALSPSACLEIPLPAWISAVSCCVKRIRGIGVSCQWTGRENNGVVDTRRCF